MQHMEELIQYLLSDTEKSLYDIECAVRIFNIRNADGHMATCTIYGNGVHKVSLPHGAAPLYFAERGDGTCRRCVMTKQGLNYVGQGSMQRGA